MLWAVKPDWRLPRALYNELERIVIEEWHDAVITDQWRADWVFDFGLLSIPYAGKAGAGSQGPVDRAAPPA